MADVSQVRFRKDDGTYDGNCYLYRKTGTNELWLHTTDGDFKLGAATAIESGTTISLGGNIYWRLDVDASTHNLKVVPITGGVAGAAVHEHEHP